MLHHHEDLGTYLKIAEIIFVIYIIYFIFKNLTAMGKMGKKYWRTKWLLVEWGIILVAGVAGFFYAYRYE